MVHEMGLVEKDVVNFRYRIAQWIIALHHAKHRVPWWGMIRSMLGGTVPRAVWRDRMRYGCFQCPIFNKERLTCHGVPKQIQHLGCRCYVPFSALTGAPYTGGCWGRAAFGPTFGWGAYEFGFWERLWSPIRFLLRK